jgi:hypothetical protein
VTIDPEDFSTVTATSFSTSTIPATTASTDDPEVTVTVTTTIYEDIFLNCAVEDGTTTCTTASVVDFGRSKSGRSSRSASAWSSKSRAHKHHEAKPTTTSCADD